MPPTTPTASTGHACASCTPGPNRVIDHERGVLNVPRGFRGPPESVHGGAIAGLIVCLADAHLAGPTARFNVRLHLPPPLATDLPYAVIPAEGGQRLRFEVTAPDGATVLSGWAATAEGVEPGLDPVVPEDIVADLAAHTSLTEAERQTFERQVDHLTEEFGECFGCGPANPEGLHLRPRAIDDRRAWSEWRPDARWLDGGGLGTLPAVAALDCSSSIPFRQLGVLSADELALTLLGTYDAEIRRRPPAELPGGESYRIVTAPRRRDGRKIWADIGLFGPDGDVYILGCATWILVAQPA